MKASEKEAIFAIVFGVAIAAGIQWLFPILPWWAFLIVAALAAGGAYDQGLKMSANKKIIDRDWPTKDDS